MSGAFTIRRPWPRRSAAALALLLLAGAAALAWPQALGGTTGYTVVAGASMEPTLGSGDLVVTRRQAAYAIGDVIVFRIPDGHPGAGAKIIHRIVGGSTDAGYRTAGDNTDVEDAWRPTPHDILGAHWRTIPAGGLVFLWLRSPVALGLIFAGFAFRLALRRNPPVAADIDPRSAAHPPTPATDSGRRGPLTPEETQHVIEMLEAICAVPLPRRDERMAA